MDKRIALQRTRMYAALRESHPLYFGDPLKFYGYGGPAWGERNGSGGGFIGTALGIGAAIFTGGASLGFTTLASTLATVSLVSSVVGSITGNKVFSSIGMLAGLGSGFMSLSSAGTFGPDLQEWSKSMDKGFTSIASNISPTAAPVEMSTVTNTSPPTSVVDTPTELNLSKGTGIVDTPAAPSLDTQVSQAAADVKPLPAGVDAIVDTVAPGAPAITGTPATPLDISKIGEPINAMQATAQQGGNVDAVAKAAGTGIDTGTSLFDRISKFANDNKAITEMTLKGVQGMYMSPQDRALKEAQATAYTASANRSNVLSGIEQQTAANGSAVANVTGMQVNPNAQIYNPKPKVIAAGVRPAGQYQGGLIQQPRSA